jgi:hypothetical protein
MMVQEELDKNIADQDYNNNDNEAKKNFDGAVKNNLVETLLAPLLMNKKLNENNSSMKASVTSLHQKEMVIQ